MPFVHWKFYQKQISASYFSQLSSVNNTVKTIKRVKDHVPNGQHFKDFTRLNFLWWCAAWHKWKVTPQSTHDTNKISSWNTNKQPGTSKWEAPSSKEKKKKEGYNGVVNYARKWQECCAWVNTYAHLAFVALPALWRFARMHCFVKLSEDSQLSSVNQSVFVSPKGKPLLSWDTTSWAYPMSLGAHETTSEQWDK